jgi:Fe2+ or Zn2+ uptake regulation protein
MPTLSPQIHERVQRTLTFTLKREHILEYLRSQGHKVPSVADIFVRVPGGDWSNMNLSIDDAPITLKYTR